MLLGFSSVSSQLEPRATRAIRELASSVEIASALNRGTRIEMRFGPAHAGRR